MLSPLILATSSIVSRSSTSTKRQGWLLKWDGAIAATSTSRRWCSVFTGSGRKGPFVVLRLLRTSRKSNLSLLKHPYAACGVKDHGPTGECGVSPGPGPDTGQHGEQDQNGPQGPTVGRVLQESHPGRDGGGGEHGEKEGVVKPPERFRVDDAKLHEYAEREVRKKEDHRDDVEDHCSLFGLIQEGYSTGGVVSESPGNCDAKIRRAIDLGFC